VLDKGRGHWIVVVMWYSVGRSGVDPKASHYEKRVSLPVAGPRPGAIPKRCPTRGIY
jgi:hypothetical protein